MNEYDSNRIYDLLEKKNYKRTDQLKDVDCYILNTCHIREKATEKVYHDVGRVKKIFRHKKKPIVIVTGCVAQAEGDILLKREKYIDAVIGPQSYHSIADTILKIERKCKEINLTDFQTIEKFDKLNLVSNSSSNVSSFLTIQEGCDKFCKFCVVPYTRGAEFSRSIEEILKETLGLIKNGAREITLLGQNVNAYNFEGKKLSDLIKKISKISGINRIRYTTYHPLDFSEDLVAIHKDCKKLMPLIHLPVQSGSNKILKNMNRKHTIEHYLELINKLKKVNPLIEFSSDFIIGYPGETKKDFEDTIKIMKKVKFINSYSFLYSSRPGTPAAKLKSVDENISKERLLTFQKIANEIKMQYRRDLFNKKFLVLFENKVKNKDAFFGRDQYNNSVIVNTQENLIGKIKEVKITGGNLNTLFGEINSKFKNRDVAA